MADINVASPGDTDIVANFPADERASRAALLALLAGDAFGGGDLAGSANAHTITVANTGLTLVDGFICWGVAAATNTDACTLQVNSLSAKALWLPNGTAISSSHPGAITSGRLYVFHYHAADDAFYVLNASGYMDQKTYDRQWKVGTVQLLGVAAAPDVPYGVTATWTLEAANNLFVRGTTGTPISTGGSLTTASGGAHTHTGTTVGPNETRNDIALGAQTIPTDDHTHQFTTDSGGTHTHTYEPPYVTYRLYRRTA